MYHWDDKEGFLNLPSHGCQPEIKSKKYNIRDPHMDFHCQSVGSLHQEKWRRGIDGDIERSPSHKGNASNSLKDLGVKIERKPLDTKNFGH